MNRLIDVLPGVSMSVESVTRTLRHMWDLESEQGGHRLGFHASQMSLILHFGLKTTPEEAQELFHTAIRFAQTYPCRIIVLCPGSKAEGEVAFEGKLFSQCYLGRDLRDVCCCEALILGYSPERSDFLESQVSVWLESDLPVYHWLHRVPPGRIEAHYFGFLKRCKRVIYDGSIPDDSIGGMNWPSSVRTSDLAYARTLPLRQHIGQFLSGYDPRDLVDNLECVQFVSSGAMRRSAEHLLNWHREALGKCFKQKAELDSLVFSMESPDGGECPHCLHIEWRYRDRKSLEIDYNRDLKSGLIKSRLGGDRLEHPLHIEPLSPEAVLGEALFFE